MSSKPRPQNSKLRARNFLPGTLLTVLFTLLLIFNCTNPPPAIETWQQAISHKNLGLAYLDRNDFDNAIKEFETVIKLLPDEPLGYADLAVTYLK